MSDTPNPRRACPQCRLVRASALTLRDSDLTKRESAAVERVLALFAPEMDERMFCAECQAAADAPEAYDKPTRCEWCGNVFAAARTTARFCSGRCRVAHHRAEHRESA